MLAPGPSCVPPGAAAQTRMVSVARIRLGSWESGRAFKGIICDDVSEFESYMPSHAVRSLTANSNREGSSDDLRSTLDPEIESPAAQQCCVILSVGSTTAATELAVNVGRTASRVDGRSFSHGQEHNLGEHADDGAARSCRARNAALGKTARPVIARSEQVPEAARAAPFRSRRTAAAGRRRARPLPGGRL